MLLRFLIFLHRWIGVVLSLIFLLWFPSGIGMMYWSFPTVTAEDRLVHSPALDSSKILLSPMEAAQRAGLHPAPAQVLLNTFDGRPIYRFSDGGGGRDGSGRRGDVMIYADTGEQPADVPESMRNRIAAAWAQQSADKARIESVTDADQWTVQSPLRTLRPLYKYSWDDGKQVYIAGNTGEVMQYTTTASRIEAHLSAIPHWVYYTPLRRNQSLWLNFMIWASGIGTVGAIIGIIVAAWLYSPSKKYRLAGQATSIPYQGQKRWHTIFGLVFGIATVTWTFSGMLSLDPPLPGLHRQAPQTQPSSQRGGYGSHSGGQSVASALRGRVAMDDFAAMQPRDLLAKNPQLAVKQLEWTSFAGKPVFAADLGNGKTQMFALDGTPIEEFDRQRIIDIAREASPQPAMVETKMIDQYDLYYLDRTRKRPLPVMLVLMHDAENTRYYIDPKTARILTTYSDRNWVSRFLYNGLHSLNFPWLYNYRPLWDIVVIAFMLGGTALCVTSIVLSWRVIGRRLKRAVVPLA